MLGKKLPTAPAVLTAIRRRDLLGFAVRGAASVIVAQSVIACGADTLSGTTEATSDGAAAGSASSSCVLTAALTEGPYFVDEKCSRFLRGYQLTDAAGAANFTTIYPGWYGGRAVHIHFMLRLYTGSTQSYAFTSQFFFDEALTSAVHAKSPYNAHGTRDTRNAPDRTYNSLSATDKSALTLQTTATSDGYAGIINLGVKVG